MKSIVLLYLLFIFTTFVSTTFSYANQKARLLDLLRQSFHPNAETMSLYIPNDQNILTSTRETNSVEDQDDMPVRRNWDSGEHYYFQWANKNRRPVEYFTGRKRETDEVILEPRARRINGGLWRSGLVG